MRVTDLELRVIPFSIRPLQALHQILLLIHSLRNKTKMAEHPAENAGDRWIPLESNPDVRALFYSSVL